VTPERRLAFEYDWQGRRIRKRFWNNREGTGTPATDLRFLYDGWNLLAVLNSAGSLVASFTWGTDLSGSAQGAGGVGGLLAISDSQSGTHFPAYDGNGNVMALLHAPNSTLSAQYEYGPFGETLSASGAMANANPFRFSTKYQDDETGLLYYGYRYYDPLSGRWPSRDPIAEGGGINLYGFLLNRPLAETDLFGLATYTLSSGKKWAYSFGFITLGGANGVRATLSATSEDLCSFDGNVVVTPRITERAFWHVYTHKTTASFFFADRKCSKYRCNVQCFKYRKDVTWQSSSIVPRPLPSIYHMYQAVTVEFTVCADGIGNTASSSGSQRGYNLDQFFTLEDF
jgi:RHS repeat-associated protein